MAGYTIRDATHADGDAWLALWRALEGAQASARLFPLIPEAETLALRQFIEAVDADDARVVVADEDGDLVGTATGWFERREWSLDGVPIVDLSRVSVRADRRSAGVGTALVAAIEDWGRARGASYLQAHMFTGNDEGLRFWERRGFRPRYEARVRPILPA
ncbi:MAG TPA: GNAT family N-acetyltransferase [Actinomycetota bacterium]|nr:GNAT family N-acetyltransferase [Actinomycetota bacterium]